MKATHLGMFTLALFVLTLSVAIVLTLVAVPTTPVPWILIGILALVPFVHKKFTARRYLKWDDSLSVGVEALDNDHRRLLSLVNQFQTAHDYSTGEALEREALDALVDYTKTHFAREEALMEKHGYPDLEAHRREHQVMISRVEDMVSRYRSAPSDTVEEALAFLKKWLIDHIAGTDQGYARHFQGKGVA